MKNVIVILFTIILAVYIGSTFVLGDGGSQASFKEVAEEVAKKSKGQLDEITDFTVSSSSEGNSGE